MTVFLQVRRWATIHPAQVTDSIPPTIHPDVAVEIARWVATPNEPALYAFGRDGTITGTLFTEIWTAMNTSVSHDLDFLALKALLDYLQVVTA